MYLEHLGLCAYDPILLDNLLFAIMDKSYDFDIGGTMEIVVDKSYGEYAKKMGQTAVEYAKDFNINFDYSEKSIADLERILDYYHKDISASKPTENQLWSMATIFGAYLGETMLNNGLEEGGFAWGLDAEYNIMLLVGENNSYMTPIHKVYNRFINGPEDSVISFYDIMMEIIQAK